MSRQHALGIFSSLHAGYARAYTMSLDILSIVDITHTTKNYMRENIINPIDDLFNFLNKKESTLMSLIIYIILIHVQKSNN